MQKLADIVRSLVCSAKDSSCFILADELSKIWDDIVGPELAFVTTVQKVQYTGKNAAVIFINVVNSAALVLKYNENSIKEKIKIYTKISDIKLIFKHSQSVYKLCAHNIKDEEAKKSYCFIQCNFENQDLKKALENLQTEVTHES